MAEPGREASTDERAWFGVLGPLVVRRGAANVPIGGPKERVVLAQLLARANEVVPVDALIDSVWPDGPPPSAERTLQSYIARLRGALEPDRPQGVGSTILVRAGAGYRLRLDADQLDSLEFERLAVEGRQRLQHGEKAASLLRQALGLWRGDPFGEFVDLEPCDTEARRLAELRLATTEDRFDAELAAGAAADLVPDLEALVATHEFRERLWGQLMLALYRSGRQRDALAAYGRARAVLIEQLGVEPGRDLRDLEAAILDQDPTLDIRTAKDAGFGLPAPLDAAGPAFVGRDAELARLRIAWLDAADGRGGFISIFGPEGMGKTRLVAELAREVQRAGGVVLYASCATRAWTLDALVRETLGDTASLDVLDGEQPVELGRSVMHLLATQYEGRPVLLVVDDAHLADDATVEALADLAGWSQAGALLVLATFRAGDATATPAARSDGESSLELRGLDRWSLERVCDIYAPGAWQSDDIDRLLEITMGVPLRVHEVVSDWARDRAVRDVGAAADRSIATQARLASLRSEIAQSVEGIQHVLEQRRANLAARRPDAAPGRSAESRDPYKGLAAFDVGDAAEFFGRERLVAELVARLAGAPLLAVVGASGSGKSSLVRAGLLPALADGVLPVPGGWQITVETPADARLATVAPPRAALRSGHLLVVDQFEELFTSGRDRAAQAGFVDRIVAAAGSPDERVVLVIRADHLDHCIEFAELAQLMAGNEVLVGPMTDLELRRAIEGPARRAGCRLEPGLVDVVTADVAGRPGALPLLSTALAETWARRVDKTLTVAAYRAAGGVNGALAHLAEETYTRLDPAEQGPIRRLLERLSSSNDGRAVDVRRRVPLSSLEATDEARAALDAFVEARLLVVDHASVEVAHEALIREWPRLRGWLDENVQGRRIHQRLTEAADSWNADEDASGLYRGTHLDAALEWTAGHPADLTGHEQAFLDASVAEAARELDEARRQSESRARANRRLRGLLASVAALLVVAVVAGVLFVRQRDRADHAARDATARDLANEATLSIPEDPERATLLAIEAMQTTQRAGEAPLPEALGALQAATQASRLLYRRDAAAYVIDASSDGRHLATGATDPPGNALIWDADAGTVVRTLSPSQPDAVLRALHFSPDGRILAVAESEGSPDAPAPCIALWDTGTWQRAGRLCPEGDGFFGFSFSDDGRRLVGVNGGSGTDEITVWDVLTAQQLFAFPIKGIGGQPVFLPDGSALVVPRDGALGYYSATDGHLLRDVAAPELLESFTSSVSAATGKLALGSQSMREVEIRDLATGDLERRVPVTDTGPVSWSPDGKQLSIAGGNQGPVRVIDVGTGRDAMVLSGHVSQSTGAVFLPDGKRLASVGRLGELRMWDITLDGPPSLAAVAPRSGAPWQAWISPDGSELLVSTLDHAVERLDASTGRVLAERTGQLAGELPYFAAVSPDWESVSSADQSDGQAKLLSLSSLTPKGTLPPCTSPVAFSPDGSRLLLSGGGACSTGDGFGLLPLPPGTDVRSRVIETATGREILDLGDQHPIFSAAFNPAGVAEGGRYLAVSAFNGVGSDFRVDLYDLNDGHVVGSVPVPQIPFTVQFDPSGRWLAAGAGDGRAFVLDVAAVLSGKPAAEALVFDQTVVDGGVPGIAITTDGVLATAGLGQQVRLWDVRSHKLVVELKTAPPEGLSVVAFDRAGTYLLYSDGPVLRRYPLDPDELVRVARRTLTRELTPDECRQHLKHDCT